MVVIAPVLVSDRLRPALSRTLPLVVVIAELTVMSRPQQTTKLPFVAVTAKFTFTSRSASNLSVVVLGVATQLTASLTVMSPLPGVDDGKVVTGGVPATVAVVPVAVLIVTLLVTSKADSLAPVMSPPVGAMMKSAGSITKLPVLPVVAAVVTSALSEISTRAADASIEPPSAPFGALASSVPPTVTSPVFMSPNRLMTPP